MNTYEKELQVAMMIAKEAGKTILEYFHIDDQQIEIKGDNSPVTIADKLVNALVIKRLSESFPEDGVIGEEESTTEYGMGRKWICDPIDGTAGYTQGTPTAMLSLALVVDGVPEIGVAYDPFLDNMYVGVKGKPSLCNGKEIHVSKKTLSEGTMSITGNVRNFLKSPSGKRLLETNTKLACFSGLVLKACLIARGRLIGIIEMGNAHDFAAVHIIIEGAGGKITSLEGKSLDYSKPFKGAIVSNGVVHDELVSFCK
jgi:fructose-1,6-bisphosphatase/inositol monophosphatase family enzyme